MVYRPDGSGRDMYVLGPRSTKGPQIVDVAARTTSSMDRDANKALLNASLLRTDNKIPNNIPPYEMRALITRKLEDRASASAEAQHLPVARLMLSTYNSSTLESSGVASAGAIASDTICPSRYNSGVSTPNSATNVAVLSRQRASAVPNGYYTHCQRSPSSYVSPKTPSTPHSASGRLGGSAYQHAVAAATTVSAVISNSNLSRTGASTSTTDGAVSPMGSSGRRTPSAGFVYNRHIYESTANRSMRTGRTFQPYEAPESRAVLPEIRARYTTSM